METNPKKGLEDVLLMIDKNKDNDEYKNMKLALLKYKGEDKCNIIHSSDSTIKTIYDYFEKNGNAGDKMEANYYMGRTYRDMHNFPLAITYFNKGIEIGESSQITKTDSMVLANIYSQISDLSRIIVDNDNSVRQAAHALEIRKKLGIDDIASYADLAYVYTFANNTDSAMQLHKECALKIACQQNLKEYMGYIAKELNFFSCYNESKMAEWTLNLAKSFNPDSIPSFLVFSISTYYIHIDYNEDSCLYYAKKAFERETDAKLKTSEAQRISLIYANRKDYETAFDYAIKYYMLEDSANNIDKIDETVSAQNMYQSQLLDKTRNELQEEQLRKNEYIAYGTAACMTMLSILGFSLYIQSKRKNKFIADIEKLEADKEEIEQKHHTLTEIVEADNKLRAESAKDVSSVLANLNAIEYNQKEILTEDMWEDVFLAVDKVHPNLRNHILSYYRDIDNKDLILIYLTVLGLKQANAARLFKNAKSVVNRKYLRLNTRLGSSLNDVLQEYKDKYRDNI